MWSYFLPSSSFSVRGRVVALTGLNTFSRCSSMREIVLLPTPDGPHRTTSRPCLEGCLLMSHAGGPETLHNYATRTVAASTRKTTTITATTHHFGHRRR